MWFSGLAVVSSRGVLEWPSPEGVDGAAHSDRAVAVTYPGIAPGPKLIRAT